MWLIYAMVEAGFVIFVGFTILPAIKLVLDSLNEDLVQNLPGLTAFESVVMGFYPIVVFLAIFFGAILAFRRSRRKK